MPLSNQQQLEYVKSYLQNLQERDVEAAEEEDVQLSVAIHFLEEVTETVANIDFKETKDER
tara:strand:+ start:15239 stop:15421 length:183 start_codon:yes stop_codon:yes gene_type:complete